MKLKKGSAEAKRFMAKIRAMKSGAKKKATKKAPKKIGATKFIEENENKNTKPSRIITRHRVPKNARKGKPGTFKSFSGLHKDTKSHNVRISVVSGIKTQAMNDLHNWIKTLEICENKLAVAKNNVKRKFNETFYKIVVKKETANIRSCKRHIATLKKHI